MSDKIDAAIDELYRRPLAEFTTARNTLAKTLSGPARARVAALPKPSVPMWAINQLHWHDVPVYKALVDASEKLRAAHKAVLTGHTADVRKAEELHRVTVEKAFRRTIAIAELQRVSLSAPARDTVRRTLSSLPTEESSGRLTREPPAVGFSLLTGVTPAPSAAPALRVRARTAHTASPPRETTQERQRRAQAEHAQKALTEKLRREAEKRARREAAQAKRDAERERRARETRARKIAKAEQALKDAERRLAELRTK